MALSSRRARRAGPDIWPGFVDALATLLMVVVFVLLVFVLAQFFLGKVLSGREEALGRLSAQVEELANMLSMERRDAASLRGSVAQLSAELQSATTDRERLTTLLNQAREQVAANQNQALQLQADIRALEALRDELEAKVQALGARAGEAEGQAAAERKLSEEARAHAALLDRQLSALRDEIARLNAALEASEKQTAEQKAQIANLGSRLNAALASKVEELQRYRSEFFGRLRQILGNQPGIRVLGDRFVFQSELLFATGSAELDQGGRAQLEKLAGTLKQLTPQIPADVNWVLRIDGHTDRLPIATARFPSNWELSTARAVSVVAYLIQQGVPAERLAAAGFGEFQPLDDGTSPDAFARNRRIEVRLDQR